MTAGSERFEGDFNAFVEVRDDEGRARTFCTKNHFRLEGDGSWLLRINFLSEADRTVELAGNRHTPLETISTAISASFRGGEHDGASPSE